MKLGFLNQQTITSNDETFPTLESIAHQRNHPAGPQLEALVIKYMDLVKSSKSAREIDSIRELKDEFKSILMSNFGINAQLYCNGYTACSITNVYIPHNTLIRSSVKEYFESEQHVAGQSLLKFSGVFKDLGYVNTRTARIGGWFSEQIAPIYINFNELALEDLSSAEITAVILHEIGHVFNAVAMSSRVSKTNQIIADVAKYISNKDRQGDVNYIYTELLKIDDELSKDTVQGLMSGNPVVMGISAFRVAQGAIKSLSNSSIYNDSSSEALADSFATRMGYGTPLATGLHKASQLNKPQAIFNEVLYLFIYALTVITTSQLLLAVAAGVISFSIVFGLFTGIATVMELSSRERVSNTDYQYDETIDRFLRIKRNLVELLKGNDVDVKTKRDVLEQLSVVDDAISKSYSIPRPIREVMKVLFVSDRKAQRSIDAQQEIEKLLANDIFISAAKLATKKN